MIETYMIETYMIETYMILQRMCVNFFWKKKQPCTGITGIAAATLPLLCDSVISNKTYNGHTHQPSRGRVYATI